jgi:hypothetical protein
MFKTITIVLVLFSSSIAFCGEIYMWTDENGVKRFSNTGAPPGAKSIGTESAYIPPKSSAPVSSETAKTKLEQDKQLEIERQKTIQKRYEALAEKERTTQNLLNSSQKTMEQTSRTINGLFGLPVKK